MRQIKQIVLALLLVILISTPAYWGHAQQAEIDGPIYIVQTGDTLWGIAVRFRVSVDDLARANNISDPGQLRLGARLVIPGLDGIQGLLTTSSVAYGDTLRSLSRRYQMPAEMLARLNHLTSPDEFYAGNTLVLLEQEQPIHTRRMMLAPGQSLLELAIIEGGNPWSLIHDNSLAGSWAAMAGEVLHTTTTESSPDLPPGPSAAPGLIEEIRLAPTFLVQGKSAVLRIIAPPGLSLTGTLDQRPLNFFPDPDGGYTSLQGVHAMVEPGAYQLSIQVTLPPEPPHNGAPYAFSQTVIVRSGNYPFDPVLIVKPETIDPQVTGPEETQWFELATPVTPEKLWQGIFQSPIGPPFNDCYPSKFGNRRSYNGSAYSFFHTGLDFCGGVGVDILAPAEGVVVFAGALTVRGNATMINHGWGVYTGYMHQSEILVKTGDKVQAGQLIGKVGETGRITGPHLHWELFVGGIQVDPLDWLTQIFP
jgi:murein DD-endopeptidase MepM/ murein hydrolase activator NlpD